MVSVNVQQDSNIWIQFQESVHEFTGFTSHDVTVSAAAAAVNAGKLSANDSGWVCSGIEENLCCHGSGGCFAMCAGDADGVVIPASYESEQFAPFHQVNTMFCSFFCSNQFRIICHNGSGVNNQVSPFDIFRTLSHHNGDTHIPNGLQGFRFVVVRTGDIIAFGMQNLHQRIHSRAANSDKMDMLFTI